MMKRDLRFSRRNLLQAIGAGAALLPLLESDKADAACLVGGIKRMYIFCWPNGMLSSINTWATKGNDPTSWQLAPFQTNAGNLTALMPDLLLLEGVDYTAIKQMPGSGERTGHACYPVMLTGAYYQTLSTSTAADIAGGPSVDQYVGSALKTAGYGGLTSLNLGSFVQSTGHLSWKAAGQVVLPNLDPTSVFNQLFSGAMTAPATVATAPAATATATGMVAPAAPPNYAPSIKKSILDYVSADLTRFANVVGTADKANIEEHLTSVRAIETQITSMANVGMASAPGATVTTASPGVGNAACNPPAQSSVVAPGKTSVGVDVQAKVMAQMAVAAFAADMTRVVVQQIGDQGAGQLVLTWINNTMGVPYAAGGPNPGDANTGDVNGFHAIAHRNVADKVLCDTWFAQMNGYIIGLMKGITDATGASMLDSSVFVGMNNMRAGLHDTTNIPVYMAGTCGGYFKTGRSLAIPAGTPHNGLLVALCNAMGTPAPGGGTYFGQSTYTGELTVLKG
jgi:uncharacterized protein DUF1552